MAITNSPRLGLTRWSSPSDAFRRAQLDGDHAAIDQLVAIDLQGSGLGDRPAPAIRGRFYTDLTTSLTYRDTGSQWHQVGASSEQTQVLIDAATVTQQHSTGTDANTLVDRTGLHYLLATSGNTNLPAGMTNPVALEVQKLGVGTTNAVVQHAYSLNSPRLRWHRYWDGSTWTAWTALGLSDLDNPTGNLSMAGYSITGLAEPNSSSDAATKGYVDARETAIRTYTDERVSQFMAWSAWTPFTPDHSQWAPNYNYSLVNTTGAGFMGAVPSQYRTRDQEVELYITYVIRNDSGTSNQPGGNFLHKFAVNLPTAIRPLSPRWKSINANYGGELSGSIQQLDVYGCSSSNTGYGTQNLIRPTTNSTSTLRRYNSSDEAPSISAQGIIWDNGTVGVNFNLLDMGSINSGTMFLITARFLYNL